MQSIDVILSANHALRMAVRQLQEANLSLSSAIEERAAATGALTMRIACAHEVVSTYMTRTILLRESGDPDAALIARTIEDFASSMVSALSGQRGVSST